MTRSAPTNSDDIINSRDVIERIEYLENERAYHIPDGMEGHDPDNETEEQRTHRVECWGNEYPEELAELNRLIDLQSQANGSSDWEHGETLIRASYFKKYAQQLAEETGSVPEDHAWPAYCIDWEWAARELRHDYFAVDFDGVEYWIQYGVEYWIQS